MAVCEPFGLWDKNCHDSPTLNEEPLQRAILTAISKAMSSPDDLIRQIVKAMETEVSPLPGQLLSLSDIERRLTDLETQFKHLLEQAAELTDGLDCMERFQAINQEIAALKEQRTQVESLCKSSGATAKRMSKAASILESASPALSQWNETVIRQLVDTVKVMSAEKIIVYLRGGTEIEQDITE